jgi:hypothetical protein
VGLRVSCACRGAAGVADNAEETMTEPKKLERVQPEKQTREGYYEWLYRRYLIQFGGDEAKARKLAEAVASQWKGN